MKLNEEERADYKSFRDYLIDNEIRRGEAKAIAVAMLGYNKREISLILGIKTNTVSSHLQRGKYAIEANRIIPSEKKREYKEAIEGAAIND